MEKSESTPKARRRYIGEKGVDRKKVNLHPKTRSVSSGRRVQFKKEIRQK